MRLRVGLAVVLLAMMASLPARAADPFVIPTIISLTGQFAFTGAMEQRYLEILEKRINGEGGVRGRPVHFQIEDDASSPQVSVQLASQVIGTGVAVFLGPGSAATCASVAPLTKNGPTNYCFSPAFHPPSGAYAFSAGTSSEANEAALVRYFRDRGWNRIATIASTDASGQDGEHWFKAALALPENKALQIVDEEHCSPGDLSVAAQLAHIKQFNPQAIFASTGGTLFLTVVRGYTDSGMQFPLGTTAANTSYPLMKSLAGLNNGNLYFPGARYFEVGSVRRGPLKTRIEDFYHSIGSSDLQLDNTAGASWDPALIVVSALRALGPTANATQIRDHILNLKNFAGINGMYDFTDGTQRGLDSSAVIVIRWDPQKTTWVPVSTGGGAALKR